MLAAIGPPAARWRTVAGSFRMAFAAAGSSFAREPRSSTTPSSDWICDVSSPVAVR